MRMKDNLECYIDGYNCVHVYIDKNFYQGNSQTFQLKDEHGEIVPLTIQEKTDNITHIRYTCTVDAPLEIGRDYVLYSGHCRTAPAKYSHIVKTPEFANAWPAVDLNTLGCHYTPEQTIFRFWSPVVSWAELVLLDEEGNRQAVPMERDEEGCWTVCVEGDLLHKLYRYRMNVNGSIRECHDPYNLFTGVNTSCSQVNDLSLLKMPERFKPKPMAHQTDAIIYECSIRDMTAQKEIGVENPKTFPAFVQENATTRQKRTGLSYIRELGITHVQLMPVLDFGSVDEEYPSLYYNWGYDPASYRALEGSYSTDPFDPERRILEFAQMVQKLHEAGIKVTLDLVFNHVWNRDGYALENMVPDYFFLMDSLGNYSNGSYCGNDIDSRPEMSRRYLIDAAMQLIDVFDVDGFRFDLMGVLDCSLLNTIAEEAKKRKPDFMIYGEGWDMPSFVPHDIRASQNNQAKMPLVGHFSDRFREVIRGSSGQISDAGYPAGNLGLLHDAKQVMCASVLEGRYDAPFKAVNYIECHDNHTLWDKNRKACEGMPRSERIRRQVLANAMVLFAQGIPFIHSGQEFGRTKNNLDNTYNRSDHYNMIDYHRRDTMEPMVDQFKELVKIRREHSSLRLTSSEAIMHNVHVSDLDSKVLVYQTQDENEKMILFFNPTHETFHYDLTKEGEVLYDVNRLNEKQARHIQIGPIGTVVVLEETFEKPQTAEEAEASVSKAA